MQMILHQSGVAVVSQNQSGIQGNRNTTARSLKAIQYCPSRLAFASKPPVGGCFTYPVTKALDARRKPGPSTTHRPTRGGDRSASLATERSPSHFGCVCSRCSNAAGNRSPPRSGNPECRQTHCDSRRQRSVRRWRIARANSGDPRRANHQSAARPGGGPG